ncbi:hypothetical protein PC116_g32294 [Phytophthora cactorum]|nr:hypothetical protein PC116_g32294 [Phytophthora cactorum]
MVGFTGNLLGDVFLASLRAAGAFPLVDPLLPAVGFWSERVRLKLVDDDDMVLESS